MINRYKMFLAFLLVPIFCTANNDFKAKQSANQIISFLKLGGIGDGLTDNSVALQNAIIYCIKNNKTLYIPKSSKFYALNKTVRVSLSKGAQVNITSNQAVLKFDVTDVSTAYKLTSYKEHVFISIGRAFNSINTIDQPDQLAGTSISISGLIIDGAKQNATDNITSYNNDIYIGAQLLANNVKVYNCVFKNISGYGIRIHEATSSTIKKSNFLNVGGRGYTAFMNKVDLDAFGDAIYFAKLNVNAMVNIENCTLSGKKKNNKRSRSGITFEFNQYTYVANLKNVNISGFAKGIHIEEKAPSTFNLTKVMLSDFNFGIANVLNDLSVIYLKNCTVNTALNDGNDSGNALGFLNYRSKAKIYVDASVLNFNGKRNAYQSAVGLVSVKNSTINANNTNFFFADGSTVFSRCNFVNFGGASKSFFSNNVKDIYQLNNCTFTGGSVSSVKASNVKLQMANSY